jgi:hypothetical protein
LAHRRTGSVCTQIAVASTHNRASPARSWVVRSARRADTAAQSGAVTAAWRGVVSILQIEPAQDPKSHALDLDTRRRVGVEDFLHDAREPIRADVHPGPTSASPTAE